jgi:putative tryptophan/tyrosine transport system substrate-binding protein
MRRRRLIGSLLAMPAIQVQAQQPLLVIGWLHPGQLPGSANRRDGFLQGLARQGFVPGDNVAIEYRWARGDYGRLPALAADLVARKVALIASGPINSTLAARDATTTIPIVFTLGVDPVAYGLVASLNRPGGNSTGTANLVSELGPKRLQLLHELLPKAIKVGVLFNPGNPNFRGNMQSLQTAASSLGLELAPLPVASEDEIETAFAGAPMHRIDALFIGEDPYLSTLGAKLAALTTRHRVPAIYYDRGFAMSGGMISYGPEIPSMYAKAGGYAGLILKGTKPADLPVVQPEKFELIINLKAAKALGLTIPPSILARADEVIE